MSANMVLAPALESFTAPRYDSHALAISGRESRAGRTDRLAAHEDRFAAAGAPRQTSKHDQTPKEPSKIK